nr:acyl-CoA dehydrogenase [bacterium]
YARDTKITSLYEGTNGIQALDLLGRKLATKGGIFFMYFMQEMNDFIGKNAKHPVLGEYVQKLQQMQAVLAQTVMSLPGFMKKESFKEKLIPILYATPFLEMFGHIALSQYHLEMGVKAQEMLNALFAEKGVADNAEGQKALLKDNDEARFLFNKVVTAKWFVSNILPMAKTIADYFKTCDTSAFDIRF